MLFIPPKREHLNSKKVIIRNKSGTKSKNKIANLGYFVWIYFGKIVNKTEFKLLFCDRWFCKMKTMLPCLINDSLMTVPEFPTVSLRLWKWNIFSQSIFGFLLFASIILQMKIPSVQSHFHKLLQWYILNWTAFSFPRNVC